jgi:hypothetical protein
LLLSPIMDSTFGMDRRLDAVRGLALGVTMGAALWIAVGGVVWALLSRSF